MRPLAAARASLTARQEHVYRLVLRQNICGQTLAVELGVSEKEVSDATYEDQDLLVGGLGAYSKIAALYLAPGIPGLSPGGGFTQQAEIAMLLSRLSERREHGQVCTNLRYLIWNGG